MCGRYSLIADLWELAQRFEFDGDRLTFESAYNVAPTQEVLTVVGGETRRGEVMRRGLIPHWVKNASVGSRMINARVETVAEKAAFRDALRRRRCLVLADGFYERQRTGAAKRPLRSGEPFAFAGLWSVWRDPNGNRVPSCTIITTSANELLGPINDRMPVILCRQLEEFWLDRSVDDPGAPAGVLTPHADDAMEAYEVSTLVNSAANTSPQVVVRVCRPSDRPVGLPTGTGLSGWPVVVSSSLRRDGQLTRSLFDRPRSLAGMPGRLNRRTRIEEARAVWDARKAPNHISKIALLS